MASDDQRHTLISLQEAAAVGFTEVVCCVYPTTEPRFLGGMLAGGENRIDASSELTRKFVLESQFSPRIFNDDPNARLLCEKL
jgi:hypothetical protein